MTPRYLTLGRVLFVKSFFSVFAFHDLRRRNQSDLPEDEQHEQVTVRLPSAFPALR